MTCICQISPAQASSAVHAPPLTSLLYETVGAAGASVVVTAMLLQASPKTAAARLSGQM